VFRPERGGARRLRAVCVPVLASLAAAIVLCGCGKANYVGKTAASAAPVPAPGAARPAAPGAHSPPGAATAPLPGLGVALPLALTPALATRFARAVSLTRADLPGSSVAVRTKSSPAEQREEAKCGGRSARTIGGGRSENFQRGAGLDRENISSAVDVLSNAAAVRGDLAYAASHGGLACYAKVLGHSLRSESDSHIRLLGLHVGHLALDIGPLERATGIRIAARVGITGTRLTVSLFVDALSMPYGPAELDLYSTSFAQPVPQRTQRELLTLLRERAQLQKL
jgi:hypothetical protein